MCYLHMIVVPGSNTLAAQQVLHVHLLEYWHNVVGATVTLTMERLCFLLSSRGDSKI